MREREELLEQLDQDLEQYEDLGTGPEKSEVLGRMAATLWAIGLIDTPDEIEDVAGLPQVVKHVLGSPNPPESFHPEARTITAICEGQRRTYICGLGRNDGCGPDGHSNNCKFFVLFDEDAGGLH